MKKRSPIIALLIALPLLAAAAPARAEVLSEPSTAPSVTAPGMPAPFVPAAESSSATPTRTPAVAPSVRAVAGAVSSGVVATKPAAVGRTTGSAPARPETQSRVIVTFKRGATAVAGSLVSSLGGSLRHTYADAFHGFAAIVPSSAVEKLRGDARVESVVADEQVHLDATQTPTASWGLDRIDQRSLPLDSSYTYPSTASNVHAYIVDTGLHTTHSDFGGRASVGFDAIHDGLASSDCNGHGTHVAGTIGGATYGVAKGVSLVSIRVLDCQGSGWVSDIDAGLDWVAQNAIKPAVVNMSLGGSANSTLDNAVNGLIQSGVTVVVAGGNSGAGACSYSPARVTAAITVGATDSTDTKASWSNYGSCLDLFAPGVSITSDWPTSNTSTNVLSGTSMATPHVVGAAALYLQDNPAATPADVASAITGAATANLVNGAGFGSPNKLLFTGSSSGGGSGPVAPVASFGSSCSNLACTFTDTSTNTPTSWSWNFGDSTTSTLQSPSHTYASGGTYTVSLTATNSAGSNTTSASLTVTAPAPPPSGTITLSATGRKQVIYGFTRYYADLTWSGATGQQVDVYRNGARYASPANSGSWSVRLNGPGTYTFTVCNLGTQTCSNTATVTL